MLPRTMSQDTDASKDAESAAKADESQNPETRTTENCLRATTHVRSRALRDGTIRREWFRRSEQGCAHAEKPTRAEGEGERTAARKSTDIEQDFDEPAIAQDGRSPQRTKAANDRHAGGYVGAHARRLVCGATGL